MIVKPTTSFCIAAEMQGRAKINKPVDRFQCPVAYDQAWEGNIYYCGAELIVADLVYGRYILKVSLNQIRKSTEQQ